MSTKRVPVPRRAVLIGLCGIAAYNAVVSAYDLEKYGSTKATYTQKDSTKYGQSEPIESILSVGADGSVQGWIDHTTTSVITAKNGAESGRQVNAVRGGSWYATSRSCGTSYRGEGRSFSGAYNTVGFRVAAIRA